MVIKRDKYLTQLISKKGNGLIKVVTGIRRCGKSYLLFELYHAYLKTQGITDECIIKLSLDDDQNAQYRNPLELGRYIRAQIQDQTREYFIIIDEIQQVKAVANPWLEVGKDEIGFVDVLIGLMKIKNADIYVTGSNSKMLSNDIVTQFRDRGDEIRLYPLSFQEYVAAYRGTLTEAWQDYFTYGGLPRLMSLANHKEKSAYLQQLFQNTYLKDVLERYAIKNDKQVLDDLIKMIASAVGSLTNPKKLADSFKSIKRLSLNSSTIARYLDYFTEAYLLDVALRYDIKGKKYLATPVKYYFTDIGLRNARLNFRQQEENHIMENIVFTELKSRGYSVDVGIVEYRRQDQQGKELRTQLEVDFVVNSGSIRYYIQVALQLSDPEKRRQETGSLLRIPDSFQKIVVLKDDIKPWYDEAGILYVGIKEFLLHELGELSTRSS